MIQRHAGLTFAAVGWVGLVISVLVADVAAGETVFRADFAEGAGAFRYVDDAFLNTDAPDYASGTWREAVGDSPAALEIVLGGRDGKPVVGMSGAWARPFEITRRMDHVRVRVSYRITMAAGYEPDEAVQLMITLDGRPVSSSGLDFVDRMTGDGDGGEAQSTGWIVVAFDRGELSAGRHVLRIGAYANKKTASDESTQVEIDEVEVSGFPKD